MIDTHCHLDDLRYEEDFEAVLQRAKEVGMEAMIIPAANVSTLERAVMLSEKYEHIYFAVGVHPYDLEGYERDYLEKFVDHPKCVAIGECGLDYFRLPKDKEEAEAIKEEQKRLFIEQIEWAKALKKPLIVHVREASEDALALLEAYAGEEGGVLHCYNAHPALLRLVERNFYFGIGGVLTFKNAKKLVAIYPEIPLERLLIETDAPYLTPHPHRGERNEPAYCDIIAQKMATLRGLSKEALVAQTTQNTQRLFGLPE